MLIIYGLNIPNIPGIEIPQLPDITPYLIWIKLLLFIAAILCAIAITLGIILVIFPFIFLIKLNTLIKLLNQIHESLRKS